MVYFSKNVYTGNLYSVSYNNLCAVFVVGSLKQEIRLTTNYKPEERYFLTEGVTDSLF